MVVVVVVVVVAVLLLLLPLLLLKKKFTSVDPKCKAWLCRRLCYGSARLTL